MADSEDETGQGGVPPPEDDDYDAAMSSSGGGPTFEDEDVTDGGGAASADRPMPPPASAVGVRPAKRMKRSGGGMVGQRLVGSRSNGMKSSVQVASVVKLFVKKVNAAQSGPWKMSSETSCTGTGFIIHPNRLLTNAHVVHRGQSILCRPQSGSTKWECTIESISLPLDLAVLKVTDEAFFRDKPPLKLVEAGFENLPHLDDNVTAVGFPTGGDQISVTRGVVSRITHNGEVLRVQIDAAINPGNSGGPVFNESGTVVGVASAHLRGASNIGYIIPATLVHLFFDAVRDTGDKCNAAMRTEDNPDGYCGVASLGIGKIQTLENRTLRTYLGMEEREGGVRVVSLDPLGGCWDPDTKTLCVQPDDVLLTVNGIPIGEDGTVQLPGRPEERIFFSVIVSSQLPMKPVNITFIRKGTLMSRTIYPKPRRFVCPRIDGYDASDPPLYLICGGFVFMPLTKPWLRAKKKYNYLLSYYGGPLTEEGRQIVMLSTVLASSVNVGYHGLSGLVLRAFDGVDVFNLQHLASLIQKSSGPLLEFRLTHSAPSAATMAPPPPNGEKGKEEQKDEPKKGDDAPKTTPPLEDEVLAILDRAKCRQMDPEIRKSHLIAAPCSPGIEFDW